jgi:outer membrane lipoprotein carrier protein
MKKLILSLLLIAWANSYAEDAGSVLQHKLNSLSSMKANFSQTVKTKKEVLQRSKGTFWLQRPGKFRWYTRTPSSQLIVADGAKLWIFDKDLEQVTVKKQEKGLGGTPALFLSGYDDTVKRDFTVSEKKSGKRDVFELNPKSKRSDFEEVKLVYQNDVLKEIHLKDHLGQLTLVKLSRVKVNPKISAKLFSFKPPKGVDVIKQ